MKKVELCISRDRVPYIVEELGADRVTVTMYNEDQDLIAFEVGSQMDLLMMFHAGVKCGSDKMGKALTSKVV
jgi:hypothetical protein